jgi:PhnB protein
MQDVNTYLLFNGTCRPAMEFYKKCLGGDLQMMNYSDAPQPCSQNAKDLVMHARLANGSTILMASDCPPDRPVKEGNNFSISIGCKSVQEIDKIFGAFSEGASVTMPLQETFWAERFGMLTDKFGVNWMFNLEKKQ